jgi:hypothetical protein
MYEEVMLTDQPQMPLIRRGETSHSLPPLAHEALAQFLPGIERAVADSVALIRARPDWDEHRTLHPTALLDLDPVQDFLKAQALSVYRSGATAEQAEAEANLVGQHLSYLLNFALHRRKVFWVDGSLAFMLQRTHLDIDGNTLRLPFPCFALAFTDRATLELCEALLERDPTCILAGQRLQILTAYLLRIPDVQGGLGLHVNLLFDARSGKWPYIVARDLYIRPNDHLDAILDSHFPDVEVQSLDPMFTSSELKRLLHLVINAILYATSLPEWIVAESPLHRARRSAQGRGEKKRQRAESRARALRKDASGEDAFFLPGKIPISQLRRLRELEQTPTGRELLVRFMVRGHWRRANASWTDQRLRWIEPYWKGPDMAAIIEREYSLKP